MQKFLNPEAEVLELNMADVICTSTGEDLPVVDPNAATGEVQAPPAGSPEDDDNLFE